MNTAKPDPKAVKKDTKDPKKPGSSVLKDEISDNRDGIIKEITIEKKGLFTDSFIFYGVPIVRLS